MPQTTATFKRTGSDVCDLHPQDRELVKLFLIQPGPSLANYSEIRVRAAADDTMVVEKVFYMNSKFEPAISEEPAYSIEPQAIA